MFTQGGSSVLFGRIRQQNFVGHRRNSQNYRILEKTNNLMAIFLPPNKNGRLV
nr:MAG TPA: hypothetical protein [Caudoviricetes sp.]